MSKYENMNNKIFFNGKNLVDINGLSIQEKREMEELNNILLEAEKQKQKEIDEKADKLEMIRMQNRVILMAYPENPYRKIVDGNIIVDYHGDFLNPDSGEKDKLKVLVGCAKVIEVGPECKYVKPGDDVYYDTRTVYPLPFMSLGYVITSESQLLCVLNEGLKDRFYGGRD